MYLNKFSMRINGGKEDHSGYVKIKHRKQYSIALRNDWDEPCNVMVNVDGKDTGTFRIEGRSSINLMRPPNDDGRFTFFRSDSAEGEASDVARVNRCNRGLVEATFTPGSQRIRRVYTSNPTFLACDSPEIGYQCCDNPVAGVSNARCCSEGITGLSGHSDQNFSEANSIELDYSRQTTITLRLVEDTNGMEARPLVSCGNVVPPPVY